MEVYIKQNFYFTFARFTTKITFSSLYVRKHQYQFSFAEALRKFAVVANRAVARTLIGGGGCFFIYSCSARLVSCQIDKFEFDFKRN